MALGDNYITSDELKAYMNIDDTSYDARIAEVCSAVSRDVEDYCHRQFNQASSASARIYKPTDALTVIVDDFYSTSGLILQTDQDDDGVFETTWDPSDFECQPINGVENGLPGWPYWKIAAVGNTKWFRGGRRHTVKLTAPWGWADVPDLVHEACLMVGADTFQVKDTRMGLAGADQFTGGMIRIRESPIAQAKLRHYVRQKVFCA